MGRLQLGCAGGKPAQQARSRGPLHGGIPLWPPAQAAIPRLPSPPTHSQRGAPGARREAGTGMQATPQSYQTAGGSCNERAEMLRTGLDHSRSHFCDLRAPPAAFIAGKCNHYTQTHGATPLPPPLLHRLRQGMGQSTKLLANQLHSAPRSKPAAPCTGWDPPSPPDKTKANPSSPQNISSAFPTQAELYFPFALAEPGISFWCFASGVFQWGVLKPVQCWTMPARKRQHGGRLHGIWRPLLISYRVHVGSGMQDR